MLRYQFLTKAKKLAATQDYVPIILPVDFCNGLGQLRSHGRRAIRSIGLSANPRETSFKSRYCIPWLVGENWARDENFVDDLIALGNALDGKGFLSITSEQFLDLAYIFRRELEKFFILPVNLEKIVSLQDKEAQIVAALAAGLDVPFTLYLKRGEDVRKKIEDCRFPLFIRAKENAKDFYAEHRIQGVQVATMDELYRACERFRMYSLIIQEYIEGPDSNRFFFGSLSTSSGQVIGYPYKLIRSVREHGSSALAISISNDEVAHLARKFLAFTEYLGPSDIAFKYDVKSKKYFFIEINNRFWKSHSLAQGCGLDLPYYQYLDSIDKLMPTSVVGPRVDVRWWLIWSDLWLAIRLISRGSLSFRSFVSSIGMPFVSGIGSWDDPLPEIYNFLSMKWQLRG